MRSLSGSRLTFPLVFVAGRGWRLPLLALAVIVLQLPLAWLGTLTPASTASPSHWRSRPGLIPLVLLARSARPAAAWSSAAIVGAVALVAFLPVGLLDPVPGAVVGGMLFARSSRFSVPRHCLACLALSAGSDMIFIGRDLRPPPQ